MRVLFLQIDYKLIKLLFTRYDDPKIIPEGYGLLVALLQWLIIVLH